MKKQYISPRMSSMASSPMQVYASSIVGDPTKDTNTAHGKQFDIWDMEEEEY